MIKYYFIYSKGYTAWKTILEDRIPAQFDLVPIKIDPVLNQGGPNAHAFKISKNPIKIIEIINAVRLNLGESIVFSDVNFLINANNSKYLYEFIKQEQSGLEDIILSDNQTGGGGTHNIGFLSIKCNKKTLSFFEDIKEQIINPKNKDGWDQSVVNRTLSQKKFDIEYRKFNKYKVWCSKEKDLITKNPEYMKNTYLIKIFGRHCSTEKETVQVRMDSFKRLGLL